MRKRTLLVLVCLAMICMVAVNGTLAQEIEKTVQNVIGFVTDIFGGPQADADELEVKLTYEKRSGNTLVPLTQTPVLYPATKAAGFNWTGSMKDVTLGGNTYRLWDDSMISGAMDKFISVTNTAKEDAYLRVAFAVKDNDAVRDYVHVNFNEDEDAFDITEDTSITIGGEAYKMKVFTYRRALKAGQSTPPMLLQVAIDSAAGNSDFAQIGNDFLRVNAVAIQASAFVEKQGETTRQLPYDEALNAALPLSSFTPFH